jgi:hypothetical protein
VAKQAEIGEIKTHGGAFEFDEGRLRQMLIAHHIFGRHISRCAKLKPRLHMPDTAQVRVLPPRPARIAAWRDIG